MKLPNYALIIAYLKAKGIDYGFNPKQPKRMGYCGHEHHFSDVVSTEKPKYNMDNQANNKYRKVLFCG
jgi:hypothetical protein